MTTLTFRLFLFSLFQKCTFNVSDSSLTEEVCFFNSISPALISISQPLLLLDSSFSHTQMCALMDCTGTLINAKKQIRLINYPWVTWVCFVIQATGNVTDVGLKWVLSRKTPRLLTCKESETKELLMGMVKLGVLVRVDLEWMRCTLVLSLLSFRNMEDRSLFLVNVVTKGGVHEGGGGFGRKLELGVHR